MVADYQTIETQLLEGFDSDVRLATRESSEERGDLRTGDRVTWVVVADRLLTQAEIAVMEGLSWASGRVMSIQQERKTIISEGSEGGPGELGDVEISMAMAIPPTASAAVKASARGAAVWTFLKSNLVRLGVAVGLIGYAVDPDGTTQAVSTTVDAAGGLVTQVGAAATDILFWLFLIILALVGLEVVKAFR